jgi:1-acyl-sn-glycerol-3-phosphate acyltransferase
VVGNQAGIGLKPDSCTVPKRSQGVARSTRAILLRVPKAPRPSWLYLLVGVLSWPIVKTVFRHRAYDVDKIPAGGGFVLAANHNSNLDPWAVGIPLFPRRFLRFMAKSELFRFPLGAALSAGGAFRVRRGEQDENAIATAVSHCRAGHAVVMFPEGTRRRKGLRKKHDARWRTGAARVALEAGVPLVPAAIAGTDRLARLGPLRVRYGDPVGLDDLSELPPEQAAREGTERLRNAVIALEDSLR